MQMMVWRASKEEGGREGGREGGCIGVRVAYKSARVLPT